MPHLQAITVQGLEADVRAAFGWLERAGVAGNAAAVGYCLGGRVAFVANSTVPLKAAASYYGGYIPPLLGRAERLSGPMLFFWGGLDHHIPEEQRQAVVKGVGDAGKPFVDVAFSGRRSRVLLRRARELSAGGGRAGVESHAGLLRHVLPTVTAP